MIVYITPLHTANKVRFKPFHGVLHWSTPYLVNFFRNYIAVNSVKGLLQINKDYAIKKTFINIYTPAIVFLQQGSKSAVYRAEARLAAV